VTQLISKGSKGKKKKIDMPQGPWDEIDQARGDFSKRVNPSRVPMTPGFRFIRPSGLSADEVFDLAAHIIKGEMGLIPEENRFRWERQAERIILPSQAKAKKSKKAKAQGSTESTENK
jgi:hypothetical protein